LDVGKISFFFASNSLMFDQGAALASAIGAGRKHERRL
jgi:hypothetical protein